MKARARKEGGREGRREATLGGEGRGGGGGRDGSSEQAHKERWSIGVSVACRQLIECHWQASLRGASRRGAVQKSHRKQCSSSSTHARASLTHCYLCEAVMGFLDRVSLRFSSFLASHPQIYGWILQKGLAQNDKQEGKWCHDDFSVVGNFELSAVVDLLHTDALSPFLELFSLYSNVRMWIINNNTKGL